MIERLDEIDERKKPINERLGVNHFGVKIFVSDLGTITRRDDNGNDIEEPFDTFAKRLESDINKSKVLVKYDRKTNCFYLIDNNVNYNQRYAYKLDINENIMEEYVFGKYNKVTSKLHDLCIKSEIKNKADKKEETKIKERHDIVSKATATHEALTPLEARVYLDYLDELNKENAKTAAKEAGKITAIMAPPVITGTALGLVGAIGTATGLGFAVGIGIAGAVMMATVEELTYIFKKIITDDYSGYELIFSYVKDSFEKLKEKIENIKLNKVKENELRKIDYVDRIVEANYTVEEEPVKELNLKDHILDEINKMVDKITYVNPDDRVKLLAEAKALLNTYTERSAKINNRDKDVINIVDDHADNMVSLRIDMCEQLALMEMKVGEIREKDKKTESMNNEAKLLVDKINEVEVLSPKVEHDKEL